MKYLMVIIVLAVLAALYYFSQSGGGGSSSCGCDKSRDPVYLDDPATNLNTPDEYRDEFLPQNISAANHKR